MKAIVLTFDKYQVFADHMISSYMKLWPNNPFIFMIPYQTEETKKYFEEKYNNRVTLINAPSDIVGTMNTLLSNYDDEEWIYWCMDDRYLINIDVKEMEKIFNWTVNLNDPKIAAIKCTSHLIGYSPENIYYHRNKLKNEFNQVFYQRKNYMMIWIHQFIRAKVLKDLFQHIPQNLKFAKEMDWIVDQLQIPNRYSLYSNKRSLMVLGESTSRGKITKNCYESLMENKFEIPEHFKTLDRHISSGEKSTIFQVVFFYTKKTLRYLLLFTGFSFYIKKRDIKSGKIRP